MIYEVVEANEAGTGFTVLFTAMTLEAAERWVARYATHAACLIRSRRV